MTAELAAFHQEFFQDIYREAQAGGKFAEDAFFETFCAQLMEAGELEEADRAHYVAQRGMRVDGYGGEPAADGTLTLIVADFHQSLELATLTATEMDAAFKRLVAFLTKSLDAKFRSSLEETSPGYGLARLIAERWRTITKVRMILISNRILSSRVDGRDEGRIGDVPLVYSVWDLGRLQKYVASGKSREDIVVDMSDHGKPVPVLSAHLTDAGYEAYLAVVPGPQLASIYDRWGARLLEQNVRVFLQARGGVNKGIRDTIENDPEMFFAYNNGITATAEGIETRDTANGLMLTRIRNLQIVNGGQTTASLHAASRRKVEGLARVFVQMKLSIVPPARAMEVVPKISEYANSQNKVNAADFFANHPFHVRMEEFSRKVHAPSTDGTFKDTKWFYERARGQYQDARGLKSVGERKKFDLEYPKQQVFTKTDLAKFITVWNEQPQTVSKGAQKNFAAFAQYIGKEWEQDKDAFNEAYYRVAIAKAIVFRETERLVSEQPWYEGGYRANIVAYAIAKLAHDVRKCGRSVNFEAIWKTQGISQFMRMALTMAAGAVKDVLVMPPAGVQNVTEWAKHEACWKRVSELTIVWPANFIGQLLTGQQQFQGQQAAIEEQKMLDGINAQVAVLDAGEDLWRKVREWGSAKRLLTDKDLDILGVAASNGGKVVSEKQAAHALKTLGRLIEEGCPFGAEVNLYDS
jgi:hypothetical protein